MMSKTGKRHVVIGDWFAQDFRIEEEALGRHGYSFSFSGMDNTASVDAKRETFLEAIRSAPRVDALLFSIAPVDAGVIDALPETCVLLQRIGTGLDNVDLARAAERGIAVRNTPEYCRREVATHAMALLLCLHRQVIPTQARLLAGEWSARAPAPIHRLGTRTLGIAGFGRIGRTLGGLMRHMVERVIYYDPVQGEAVDWAQPVELEAMLGKSDLISLHLPLTPDTRHFVQTETLALMKPTAVLVNTARGGLVDADALAEALNEGRLAGAGLDVYEPEVLPADSPLRTAKNIVLTSHTAWYSEQALVDARVEAMGSIIEHFKGGKA